MSAATTVVSPVFTHPDRDVRQRQLVPPQRLARCHAVVVGVQMFVLVSGRIELGPAAFLVGLIWLLLHAVQQFCRILFVRVANEV